jgi:hypothetical protein
MTLDAAMNLCKKRRPIVDPIAPFLLQLEQYESKCRALGVIPTVDEEGKSSTTVSDSNSLKRKAIGPIMPPTERSELKIDPLNIMSDSPLGSTENEKQEDPESTPFKNLKCKAIRPIMPPSERSELRIHPFSTGNEKQEDDPTPSKGLKRKAIGPALPLETSELAGDPLNTIGHGLRGSTENESTTVMDTPQMTDDGTNLTTTRFE